MKLSEAMMLGTLMTQQAFGEFIAEGRACALGAAGLALDCKYFGALLIKVPWIGNVQQNCPECGSGFYVGGAVVCLNDNHHWTRERIAGWVATIEPQDEQTDGWAGTRYAHAQSS